MRLFLILFVGVIVIVVVQAVRAGAAGLVGAPIGVVVGYLLGLVASRMISLSWNNEGHRVVGRMDVAGAIVLVLYVLLDVNRTRLVSQFAAGDLRAAISHAVLAGLFLGQLVGTAKGMGRVIATLRPTQTILAPHKVGRARVIA